MLHDLTRDLELDFLVLFSSLSTLVGGVGLSVYGAANSFLDAYATSQSGRADRRVLAIGWDTWREVGMATGLKTPAAAAKVDSGLSAEEGLETDYLRIRAFPFPASVASSIEERESGS